MKAVLFLLIITLCQTAIGQVPPCGSTYGSGSDESNIISEMRYGTIQSTVNAINQAKNTRGTSLGCPEVAIPYSVANITEPTLSEIESIWNTVHSPAISSYTVNCPRIGRYENNAALGAYYAMQAGYFTDSAKLIEIANMMYDQQYASWNVSGPDTRNEGVYGFINVPNSDPCNPGGVVGSSVSTLCSALPQYCVNYSNGQFSGENFAISGQDDANNWFDGGLAYDHGWVGIQMIESAIMQNDLNLKQKFRNSVALAGQYAISEHSVKNHNYTAKLIWLLSQLYAWTGDAIYKNEVNEKLNKNLLPGILWDSNTDGFVDGTSPAIAFNALTTIAQLPGRMWDGHNSTAWYQAMNTWALTEAYVAFRDRGDMTRANELKPYVVAMLDNLASEVINQGVVSMNALGVRDITYAFLTGIWKVSQYENENHLNWEHAAWAMWNTGYFNTYNTHSVCVGLYLLIKSNTQFMPLHMRENYVLNNANSEPENVLLNLFPNPTEKSVNVVIPASLQGQISYSIFDIKGAIVKIGNLEIGQNEIELKGLEKGFYTVRILNNSKFYSANRFVYQ